MSAIAAPAQKAGLVLVVMCAGMFLVLLDVTAVNVAVPTIVTDLRTTTTGIQWVVDGYAVALASLLLAGGALGDRFGHRRVVAVGLVVFGAASLGCAIAPSAGMLIAARAAQGVGAALLLPGSIAAIADAYPERAAQARALGIWAGVSSLALPTGPLLGGLLVSRLGWRSVFWINPPVTAICLVGVLVWVRAPRGHPRRRLDLAGLVLGTIGLAAVVYAVIAVGSDVGAVAIAGAAGALALVAFVLVERRVAVPLVPLTLFRRPMFAVANGSALLMNLTSNGLLFLLTRYLQSVLGYGALETGVLLLPMFVPIALLSPLAGRLTARHGPRPVLFAGAIFAAVGQLCLLLVTPTSAFLQLIPALLGVGLGVGLFTAPIVATAIRSVPAQRSGLASGINNTARQAGTALGVAIYGVIAASPTDPGHFIDALRILGVAAAVLWMIAAVLTTASLNSEATRRVDKMH